MWRQVDVCYYTELMIIQLRDVIGLKLGRVGTNAERRVGLISFLSVVLRSKIRNVRNKHS